MAELHIDRKMLEQIIDEAIKKLIAETAIQGQFIIKGEAQWN